MAPASMAAEDFHAPSFGASSPGTQLHRAAALTQPSLQSKQARLTVTALDFGRRLQPHQTLPVCRLSCRTSQRLPTFRGRRSARRLMLPASRCRWMGRWLQLRTFGALCFLLSRLWLPWLQLPLRRRCRLHCRRSRRSSYSRRRLRRLKTQTRLKLILPQRLTRALPETQSLLPHRL